MAELDPLMQLRDIHLPKEALNWPPAPGWYILFVIFLLAIFGISIFIKLNLPIWQTKRHALQLLKHYQKQYRKEHNIQKTCALINELLKQTAFYYYPRSIVASLKGQDWLDFLNNTMQRVTINHNVSISDFNVIAKELLEYPYQHRASQKQGLDLPQGDDGELGNLFNIANIWIKNQRSFSQKTRRSHV